MLISEYERKIVRKICDEIIKHDRFFLTTHQVPDGDGLGCELAFSIVLRKLGKQAIIVNEMLPSAIYSFLPGYSDILPIEKYPEIKLIPDAAIIFDCSNKERIGRPLSFIPESVAIINIDHHQGNTQFGHINWVCENCSSVGEMCFFILEELNCVDKEVAECLYVAILTDTGSFRHHFDTRTIRIAERLLSTGINPESIADHIYNSYPVSTLKLLGHALVSLQYDMDLHIAWTVLDEQMLMETGAFEQDAEIIVDMLRSIGNVDFVFLVKERKNEIKFSLRSKKGFNVRLIAEKFGGGGHDGAAGFSMTGITLTDAIEKFLRYLKKHQSKRQVENG
ncbi:MAG TPA: DHHA1 domain-containing protein [bacterium]|nr:DHHA1 domain-containing protein [bacterium]HOL34542.1 DHHA1 domain-containing protein [bacterium]HPP07528.1 DHHA1 domain-containing protein [bacterium]